MNAETSRAETEPDPGVQRDEEREIESRLVTGWTVTRYRSRVYFGERPVFDHVDLDAGSWGTGLEEVYLHLDHQGSVDRHTVAGGTPTGSLALSFDAYGKRRNTGWTNNHSDTLFNQTQFSETGYTGHQHLDSVRMIHMSGRVEEPIWGRMLSPAPVLGDLSSPQSLNPYSYVSNNPLTLVDPSGSTTIRRNVRLATRPISRLCVVLRAMQDSLRLAVWA